MYFGTHLPCGFDACSRRPASRGEGGGELASATTSPQDRTEQGKRDVVVTWDQLSFESLLVDPVESYVAALVNKSDRCSPAEP